MTSYEIGSNSSRYPYDYSFVTDGTNGEYTDQTESSFILPTITAADANKFLEVNDTATGYQYTGIEGELPPQAGEVFGWILLGFIALFLALVTFTFLVWCIDKVVEQIRDGLYDRQILKTQKEVFSFGYKVCDDRLYEILDHVYRTEYLPDMTDEEEKELLWSRDKLISDYGTKDSFPRLWWLTEQGEYILKKLRCM